MKLAYFASIRERIGLAEEDVSVPDDIGTVADLIGWLAVSYTHLTLPTKA